MDLDKEKKLTPEPPAAALATFPSYAVPAWTPSNSRSGSYHMDYGAS